MRKIKRRYQHDTYLFTPRIRRLLYAAIKADLPYTRACQLVGVKKTTFKFWLKKGKRDQDVPGSAYAAFRNYIKRIEARKEKELLAVIDKVAVGNYRIVETELTTGGKWGRIKKRKVKVMAPQWKAAAWRLERKYKEDYAPLMPNHDVQRSPEEIASAIYEATQNLQNSVPTEPEE